MNRLKPFLKGVAAAAVMSAAISFQAFAARIAFSDPSAEAGSEVAVSMKITAGENESINSSNVMLSYDPQSLQFIEGTGATGDAGSIRVVGEAQGANSTELVFSLKFKALKPGTTKISVSTQEIYNRDGGLVNVDQEGSSTITITGEAVAGGGAALAGLQISPGVLSPAFSPDIDSYTASVGGDVDSITVDASAADGGASVSVSGNEGLQLGANEIICTVTSADGQTRIYRIQVTKTEGNPDEAAPAAQVVLRTYERNVTVLSAEEGIQAPEGFIQCSVKIDGQAVRGWIQESQNGSGQQAEYCIFYAMNEEGQKGFYRYDLTEKTLQRYFRDDTAGGEFEEKYNATAQDYNALLRDYEIRFWIILGLIGLSVVLLVVIIVLVATRGQKDDFIERREDDDEEQWEAEKKTRRSKLSREEKYLRGLEEEEEEAEREEDLAFIRKVQSGRGNMAAGGGAARGQTGQPGSRMGGSSGSGSRQTQPGGSGRIPSGQARGGQAGTTGGSARGGQAGTGARPGQPGSVPRGVQPGGAGAGSRPADSSNRAGQTDDDFEVIDLE